MPWTTDIEGERSLSPRPRLRGIEPFPHSLHLAPPDRAGSTTAEVDSDRFSAANLASECVRFGIREHAMAAILNGIALQGPWRPFASTYLVFSDYMRPSIRLGALMGLGAVYVYTHDSVAVGEDGPTHQPVEQIASLRTVPGLDVVRPADSVEVVAAWRRILASPDRPVALILSRQDLPCCLAPTRPPPGSRPAATCAGSTATVPTWPSSPPAARCT
jgi:transketolase